MRIHRSTGAQNINPKQEVLEDFTMKKKLTIWACIAVIGVLGCSRPETVVEIEQEPAVDNVAGNAIATVRHDVIYVCGCGPGCDCNSVSADKGTCSCGSELVAAHVVMVEGHDAKICTCGNDCRCEIDAEDTSKCSCGSAVKTVSLEGKGLYFCNCGGSCTCNYVSAEPGTCTCGMELIS
jgi:hypothetical protein